MRWNWFSSQPRERKNEKRTNSNLIRNFSLVPHYVVTSAILMQNAIYHNCTHTHTQRDFEQEKNHMNLAVVYLAVTENPYCYDLLHFGLFAISALLSSYHFKMLQIPFRRREKCDLWYMLRWRCLPLKCRNKIERYIITTLTLALLLYLSPSDRHICFTSDRAVWMISNETVAADSM